MSENLIIVSSVFLRTSARSTCRHSWWTDTTFSVQIPSLNYLLQGKMGHWESWYVVQSIPLFLKKNSPQGNLLPIPQNSVQLPVSLWKIPRSRVKESFFHIAILKCNSASALLMLHWHYLCLGYPTSKAKTVYCSSLWPDQVALHLPGGSSGKELTSQCKRWERCRFDPGLGRFPWKRAGQPTPVFLPGESHGQWSLVGYSP